MLIFFVCCSVCSYIEADASVGLNVISFGVALLYLRAVSLTSFIKGSDSWLLHMFVMQHAGMKLGQRRGDDKHC